MRKNLTLLLFLLPLQILFSQNTERIADSLQQVIRTSADKHVIISAKTSLIKLYSNAGKVQDAQGLYNSTLAEAKRLNYLAEIGGLYNTYGTMLYNSSQYDSALYYFEQSLAIREQLHDTIGALRALNNVGSIYYSLGDYKKGLIYLEKGLKKESDMGIEEGTYIAVNNIGLIYSDLKLYRKSFYYFKKAEKINLKRNDTESLLYSYDGMATSYERLKLYDSSLIYSTKALKLAESINNAYFVAYCYNSIGIIYNVKKDFAKAIDCFNKGLELNKKLGDGRLELSLYGNLTVALMEQHREKEAYACVLKVMELEKQFGITSDKAALSEVLATFYAAKNDYRQAYDYLKEFNEYQDSLYRSDITNQISELQTKYDSEKKEKDNQLLQKENELKNAEIEEHKTTRNYLIVIVVIALAGILGAVFAYRKIKRSNELLAYQKQSIEQKNELLEEQKHEISEKSKEITDSIQYAQNIQLALVPSEEEFSRYFPESFILFQPKDIVSGDFYWAQKKGDMIFFALADCTGHGVPGAFMSMLGMSFLDELVGEKMLNDPAEILDLLRIKIISSLNKTNNGGNERKDGMDIVFCAFHSLTGELHFAAANNALYHIRNNAITEYKGDKQPVGMYSGDVIQYTHQKIQLQPGDAIYLTSDGYPDQFGGPKGKKFKYKQLEELFLEVHQLPAKEQSKILLQRLKEWRGMLEQIDDVCVIGIHL